MEVVDLASVGNTTDVEHGAIVAMRYLIRVLNDLIDEIPKMQDERQAIFGRGALIFPNHASVGILRALIHALARNESKAHRSCIVDLGRRDRAADTAAIAFRIDEAIPVNGVGL